MQARWRLAALVVLTMAVSTPGGGPSSRPTPHELRCVSAAVFDGRVVSLDESGTVRVWSAADGTVDTGVGQLLSQPGLRRLTSDGAVLWAAGDAALFRWSAGMRQWEEAGRFDAGGEKLDGLACVGGEPLLVYPSKVLCPTTGRRYDVPALEGPGGKSLRTLAVFGDRSTLWIGTGHGEWGGQLVGLNPQTGRWVCFYDSLHYVTGITSGPSGGTLVAWSMSHFYSNTLVRVHGEDGRPTASSREQDSHYYQRVAFSAFDRAVYAVDGTDMVVVRDGHPERVVELEGPLYTRERMAVGSGPGVVAVLPVARETVVVVPEQGAPMRVQSGRLSRLPIAP